MRIPFSTGEFLAVFRAYNEAVWPAQVVLYALGVALVLVALRGRRPLARWLVPGGLTVLWAWMAGVYHWRFFAEINPAAPLFAGLFLLQALLWLLWARREPALGFRPETTARRLVGGGLLGYALLAYPLLNIVSGHGYPAMPTFGLPCPTTIATFGLLAWGEPRPPWYVWLVPVAWALVGTSAAFALGVHEDLGLAAAAVLAGAVHLRPRREVAPPRGTPG